MQRLVYAPKVHAFVRTNEATDGTGIVDLSDFIVRGSVHRQTNAVSTAEIELRNPDKVFTRPGRPLLRPMDPITIYLTRIANRPVQVFTGYLDTTPYLQLFPGAVKLTASCTLKRLLHTYWDPSLPYVFGGFLREYGWNLNPKTGQMFSDILSDGPLLDENSRSLNDGSFGALLFATLKHVGQWDSENIYIEKLPDGTGGSADIVEKVTAIYNSIAKDNEAIQENVKHLFAGLLGSGPQGDGGGPAGDTPTASGGPEKFRKAANKWGPKCNCPANVLMGIAEVETNFGANNGPSSAGARGYMQFMPATRQGILAKYGVDAFGSVDEAVHAAALYLRDAGIAQDVRKGIFAYNHADWYVDKVLKAAEKYKDDDSSKDDDDSSTPTAHSSSNAPADEDDKNNKDERTPAHGGAAPKDTANDHSEDTTTRWDAILAEANRINKKGAPYAFGRGHASPVPKGGPWDCSSAVSGLLQAAGYDIPTFATPAAPSILRPGEGKRITFWNNANPGRGGHIYAVIDGRRWGAESSQNTGWLSGDGPARAGYKPFTVPGGEDTLDEPADIPADADTTVPGGGDPGSPASDAGGNSNASAFAAYLNLPGVLDTAEAIGLAGQKSLLNDQSLFPFIQQLCQGSLRNFMSMPNGNFFAFFPDHFGGFGHRTPYWLIDDIEIVDGGFDLSDEFLATHVYIIGDTNFDFTVNWLDRLQSGGVMDLESAFKSGFIKMPEEGGLGVQKSVTHDDAVKFLQKYGARPYKDELAMIRSPYFEAFLAYQKFMELWAKQFATKFEFTFMPELYPGGIVGLHDHGIQCYIEEVVHSFDYENGFTTQAILSSPAAMEGNATPDISAGMVRAFDAGGTSKSTKTIKPK